MRDITVRAKGRRRRPFRCCSVPSTGRYSGPAEGVERIEILLEPLVRRDAGARIPAFRPLPGQRMLGGQRVAADLALSAVLLSSLFANKTLGVRCLDSLERGAHLLFDCWRLSASP